MFQSAAKLRRRWPASRFGPAMCDLNVRLAQAMAEDLRNRPLPAPNFWRRLMVGIGEIISLTALRHEA
jgi:hypothetical protein